MLYTLFIITNAHASLVCDIAVATSPTLDWNAIAGEVG